MIRTIALNPDDKREVFEIARIQNGDDFLSLRALIRRGLNTAKENCIDKDGVILYRNQGAAIVLRELLETFETAKELAEKRD